MPEEPLRAECVDCAELASRVPDLAGQPVLVVGDLMLDHYLAGEVERISPEAPVPVVNVHSEAHMLGGAGNVARNLVALGGRTELLSMIGQDDPGRVLEGLLAREGITGHLLVEPRRKTTIKTRIIARNQQMLRVDREEVRPIGARAMEGVPGLLAKLVDRCRVVVVSDYGKGLVTRTFMDGLRQAVAGVKNPPLVLVDPKVVNLSCYQGVDLLTPNAKEAGEMAGIKAAGRDGVLKAGLALFKRLRCKQLCVTLGAEGMALFERPNRVLHVPTTARKVFDVTGAGDTAMAVLALGLAAGLGLVRAGVLANVAAGIVVAQVGAAVATPGELVEELGRLAEHRVQPWLDIA